MIQIYDVAMRMRQRDYDELTCLGYTNSREGLAEEIALRYCQHGCSYAIGLPDIGPIVIFTYSDLRPGVLSFGMFATEDIQKISKQLTKWVISDIIEKVVDDRYHRVEVESIHDYSPIHKWLKLLGFKEESLLRAYGRNGEDFKKFSWVREQPGNLVWQGAGKIGYVQERQQQGSESIS